MSVFHPFGECGVIARWTDASNYCRLTCESPSSGTSYGVQLVKVVAGTETVLATATFDLGSQVALSISLDLTVHATGTVVGRVFRSDGTLLVTLMAADSALATGGTLEDGLAGIIDSGNGSTTQERWYDNVTIAVPPPESIIIYPGRSMVIEEDAINRESANGSSQGRPRSVRGGLLKLPPAGSEGRVSRVVVRGFQQDAEVQDDVWGGGQTVTASDLQVQLLYTPRVRLVPA
jgi:hypothetical protein